jgi:hypothetical protein
VCHTKNLKFKNNNCVVIYLKESFNDNLCIQRTIKFYESRKMFKSLLQYMGKIVEVGAGARAEAGAGAGAGAGVPKNRLAPQRCSKFIKFINNLSLQNISFYFVHF